MADLNDVITDRRRQTRSSIYHYLYASSAPCSKQEIARDLNLSLPTVYQNVAELLDAGLIEYAGAGQSLGGRPAMKLRIVADARVAIGISITGHRRRFTAADLSREETAYKDLAHQLNVEDEHYAEFVARQLELFIDENSIDRSKLLGIGITLAGIIIPEEQTVFYAPTLYIRTVSLKKLIEAIPYPVYTENDANSGGFAEWFGSNEREAWLSCPWQTALAEQSLSMVISMPARTTAAVNSATWAWNGTAFPAPAVRKAVLKPTATYNG